MKLSLTALILYLFPIVYSQELKSIQYEVKDLAPAIYQKFGASSIPTLPCRVVELDAEIILKQLQGVASRRDINEGFQADLSLPLPDSSERIFRLVENTTMSKTLALKFPEIISLDGWALDQPYIRVKMDVGPNGLHAMIIEPGKPTVFIDPYRVGDLIHYMVYRQTDLLTKEQPACEVTAEALLKEAKPQNGSKDMFGTCEFRMYRLALAATGEYTQFHGGTISNALAAQVTTMNRVNGIYERDLAITMVLVPNNDLLISTNPSTDPYTNGNPSMMMFENQSNCDTKIGQGNYDIGHVFGTNSGGLASVGVVCSNGSKAKGVSGNNSPIGDPFDIDYVAHEIGHQFGAHHTQNNGCNRYSVTAVEPGSGSTLMGYAGLCTPNVQSHSDDYFHGISLQEIGIEITSLDHTCPQITSLNNIPPIINSTSGNIVVPAYTPFMLEGNAVDGDGDPLTYQWEQMDNEISLQPPSPTEDFGPNFRSTLPSPSPKRYFPRLEALAAGGPYTWEVLPGVNRTMNFRLTVKDFHQLGGCYDHEELTVTLDQSSGPFVVTYPSSSGIIWEGLTNKTINWNVNNTQNAPVSCSSVNILLSTDGGLTYPTVLASNTPNDGTQSITIPNVSTSQARIMVQASSGHFFDISDNNFTITYSSFDYSLSTTPIFLNGCQGEDAHFTIDVGSVGGFTNPVTLAVSGAPSGTSASFSSTTVIPGNSSVLTLSNTAAGTIGTYELGITANSTTGSKTNTINFVLSGGVPDMATLLSPTNGAIGLSVVTEFTWSESSAVGATYTFEVSTSGDFAVLTDLASGLTNANYTCSVLATNTTYYWRVLTVTGCGQSQYSETYNFTTSSCSSYTSTDGPLIISSSGTPTINSTINVPVSGSIIDVNVLNVEGTHSWVSDLTVALQSPEGSIVPLFSNICGSLDNFNLGFDDQSDLSIIDCPPVNGQLYQPSGNLNTFNTENPLGNWKLIVSDGANQDGGTLTAWTLEVCINVNPACIDPSLPTIVGDQNICPGESVHLQVAAGSLNEAEHWYWYQGTCGTNPVGSGTELTVTPSVSSQYFVRGEGGCVNPGNCTMFQVNVQPNHNLTVQASICEGESYIFPDGSIGTNSGVNISNLTSSYGCDSTITTNLVVHSNYYSIENQTICQGQNFTYPDGSVGNTTEVHMSYLQSVFGCDSIIQTNLQVNPTYFINTNAFICQGATYIFPDGTLATIAQTHQSHLVSSLGCDSIINTSLIVYPTYSKTEEANICQGDIYTYPDGTTGASSEIHQSHLYTIHGCDSIITTQLLVHPTYSLNESVSICNGETYIYPDGTIGSITEMHISNLYTINHCDSVIATQLTVLPTYAYFETIEICQGTTHTFPDGTEASSSQIHASNFTATNGCDSIITSNLIVHPNYLITESIEICVGGTYTFPDGTQGSTDQMHTSYLLASTGCDSTIVTNLTVVNVFNITRNVNICEGDVYVYPDGSFGSVTESHLSNLVSSLGCDSNITTNLFVRPHYYTEEVAHICGGDSYMFPDGSTAAQAITHTSYLQSSYGCDSTIVTQLLVDPSYTFNEVVEICDGTSILFPDGQIGDSTQQHTSLLSTKLGCDSTIVTDLIVHPLHWNTEEVFICPGDTYVYPDGTIGTSEESYISSLQTEFGCDSLITTDLMHYPTYDFVEVVHICEGDTYVFPDGSSATSSSTHMSEMNTIEGCDSLITTQLIVDPIYYLNQEIQICQGESYTFPDGTLGTVSQTQVSYLTASSGCDSIIETHLLVRLTFATGETVNICDGEVFTFPDGSVGSNSQVHLSELVSQGGCDSLVTTTLVVHNSSSLYQYPIICSDEVYIFPDGALGTTTGPHTSHLLSEFGCDSTIVSNLTVIDINTAITLNGHTLSAVQLADSYQWLDCDQGMTEITGATNRDYTPFVDQGNFAVRITISSCTETSSCFNYDVSGLEELGLNQHLIIYPNPTQDLVHIQWPEEKEIHSLQLLDIHGKLIIEQVIQGEKGTQISMKNLERGMYFLHVNNTKEIYRIVKN